MNLGQKNSVIRRRIGKRIEETINEDDGTVHRCHVDQIHIPKSQILKVRDYFE